MNICPTTILYNNGLHIIGKSIKVKRKFQSFSGAFCFGHAAAIHCSRPGGRKSIPDRDEIKNFLRNKK
ncbi:uncharacterized protein METZ01_LOCUS101116 [marine metagenome]|uniref:Uncharacterized protein n=1 Tax=marine metagenome TaxID=408172 RepID=A0A381W723_9ZZZZ